MIPNFDTPSSSADTSSYIFDADEQNFEDKVLQASMTTPVIVDFWAPWCGPCKQLMPVLEKVVQEEGGKVLMAKINIDENPQLAQAFKVQSVPTVYVLYQGQPVTAFNGVKPESELKKLITQLGQMSGGENQQAGQISVDDMLEAAEKAASENNYQDAYILFKQILAAEPENVAAYVGVIKALIAVDQIDDAKDMVVAASDNILADPRFEAAKKAIELADNAASADELGAMEAKLESAPDNHELRFELATACFGAKRYEEAIDHLVEIIKQDREWEDEKARKQLLEFFDLIGAADPVTLKGRRKLSTVLFS